MSSFMTPSGYLPIYSLSELSHIILKANSDSPSSSSSFTFSFQSTPSTSLIPLRISVSISSDWNFLRSLGKSNNFPSYFLVISNENNFSSSPSLSSSLSFSSLPQWFLDIIKVHYDVDQKKKDSDSDSPSLLFQLYQSLPSLFPCPLPNKSLSFPSFSSFRTASSSSSPFPPLIDQSKPNSFSLASSSSFAYYLCTAPRFNHRMDSKKHRKMQMENKLNFIPNDKWTRKQLNFPSNASQSMTSISSFIFQWDTLNTMSCYPTSTDALKVKEKDTDSDSNLTTPHAQSLDQMVKANVQGDSLGQIVPTDRINISLPDCLFVKKNFRDKDGEKDRPLSTDQWEELLSISVPVNERIIITLPLSSCIEVAKRTELDPTNSVVLKNLLLLQKYRQDSECKDHSLFPQWDSPNSQYSHSFPHYDQLIVSPHSHSTAINNTVDHFYALELKTLVYEYQIEMSKKKYSDRNSDCEFGYDPRDMVLMNGKFQSDCDFQHEYMIIGVSDNVGNT